MARPAKPAQYVSEMGMLYRMSHANWLKFCAARATDRDVAIEGFGTLLACGAHNVTDWDADAYQGELEQAG